MKNKVIILILISYIIFSISGEIIPIESVSNYQWEASAYTLTGVREDFTYFFNFKQDTDTVVVKKMTSSQELKWDFEYNYQSYFDDPPYHIRIYNETPNQPSLVIMNSENDVLEVTDTGSMLPTFESFQTLKAFYRDETIEGALNTDRVRIRTAPSLEGLQIGLLHKDEVVTILNESDTLMRIGDMESVWYKVKTETGIVGWSYGYFIDLQPFPENRGVFSVSTLDELMEDPLFPNMDYSQYWAFFPDLSMKDLPDNHYGGAILESSDSTKAGVTEFNYKGYLFMILSSWTTSYKERKIRDIIIQKQLSDKHKIAKQDLNLDDKIYWNTYMNYVSNPENFRHPEIIEIYEIDFDNMKIVSKQYQELEIIWEE